MLTGKLSAFQVDFKSSSLFMCIREKVYKGIRRKTRVFTKGT